MAPRVPKAHDQPSFLAGGGEMGERMRAFDWERTPLGPAARWPRSLQTAVRIVLTARQPMFVWWGEGLVNLYNDAYRAVLGGKHPYALGRPAAEVWREIWPQVGPRAASALLDDGTFDEALLLVMERNGYPEETYYTFSYSPVPDDAGGTGGILCACTEETRRILGERQLALLRDLASATADARSLELACSLTADCLVRNPRDFPFALLYLVDAQERAVRLAGVTGLLSGHPLVPMRQALDSGSFFPIGEVLRTRELAVVDLPDGACARFPSGAWDVPPSRAALVPVATPGEREPIAVLIVGLSPYRAFDASYRSLLELTASQLATSFAAAQAYEQEHRRVQELAQLDRAKTAFFSNVSHEFRTPLTLMLGPTEDALASTAQTLSGDDLRIVYRSELRLLKLVNTLLDFARIEAGRAEAVYHEVDLSELTADLASVFRSAIERAGLAFEVRCPKLPGPMYVDPAMWEKIVLNLLSNALKFTFEGAIALCLEFLEGHAVLTVRDTGTGIPADELPHLFERFHRVRGARARAHEGSGIGLALVHELVRLHGGSIAVTSEVDVGTTFRVRIPSGTAHLRDGVVRSTRPPGPHATQGAVAFVEEALRWLPGEPLEPALPSVRGDVSHRGEPSGERILVVDDNADMREYLGRLLGSRFEVDTAPDGLAALEQARARKPALVVTDVMMPRLDGFGLLRALRGSEELRDVPVLMLSARAGEEARVEGLRAGVEDYLVKPFSARELLASVEAQIARAKLRRIEEEHAERLRDIFQHAPVGIAILRGPEHVFELANADFLRQLGKQAVLGLPVRDALPELSGQGIFDLLGRVFESGELYVGRSQRIVLATGPGGAREERAFDFAFQPLSAHGEVERIIAVLVDVTELFKARRQAEAASRTKDEFLAMLGHELRNPLAPIVTALHLMSKRLGDAAARERAIIERQVDHLSRLVDDLLDISRITRGKVELKREVVELSEVVAKAVELASPLLERRHHELEVSVPHAGLRVLGDPMRLAQVVSNLLTNAAKYTDPRGHVRVHAEALEQRVVLHVTDDGIGIAPEMLPNVFDTFVQERQAIDRSHGGLGLGLAIVKNLVAMHGGRVRAESAGKGRGSTFTVDLPRVSGELQASRSEEHGGTSPAHGLKLLLVDDNEDAAELLADALRELGHETQVAREGPAALRVLERYTPDVCLLDVGLPVMDGYELARRIRELPDLAGVRLVALTGYGQANDRARARAAGFDEHLVKPVEVERVASVLRQLRPAAE